MKILLDSNAIIDYLRQDETMIAQIDRFLDSEAEFFCCDVTVVEIISGMKTNEEQKTLTFLHHLSYLPTNYPVALKAGLMRNELRHRGITVSLPDAMIASVSQFYNCSILTKNHKDFRRFPGLKIIQNKMKS